MAEANRKEDAHRRVISRLREQAEEVRRLFSGLDEAKLSTRTIPEKWSLKELVCHLGRVQQVFQTRLDALLTQDSPVIASYEPEGDAEFDRMAARPAEESLSEFLAARRKLTDRLDRLSAAQWHRSGSHPECPRYDVHFAMEYLGHHEAHHIYQMFQRRAPLAEAPH
jgi:hypothetical protein